MKNSRSRRAGGEGRRDDVYRITSARPAHSDDMDARVFKYAVSMSVRMACILLVFVVPWPYRWVFIVGAVVLPYVAVVLANAGRGPREAAPASTTFSPSRPALPPRRDTRP